MSDNLNVSRRALLVPRVPPSAQRVAAGMPGHGATPRPNRPKIEPGELFPTRRCTATLVIGSGMAGVFAAVKAHDAGRG